MRLIDADALIEAHYDYCETHHGEGDMFYMWSLELMRTAPTIEPTVNQWIPCSERLPNKDGKYIVFGYWEGKEDFTLCGFYTELGRFGASWHFDIIAWMPLPQPYRGDEE